MPGSTVPLRVPIIRPSKGVKPIEVSTQMPLQTADTDAPFPSAFSGHLLGNNEGFVGRTSEVSIHSLHQFSGCQQTGGVDRGSFPMDPMRLQGVEPRTFDRQETRQKADALAVPFDAPVVLADP